MTHPQLSVGLPNYGSFFDGAQWRRYVDLARAADDAGVDRIIVVDHVVMGPNTDAYVWGRFPVPPEAPWLEPLTVLAAVASATARVRLATGILIAPLRPAVLLAKQAATLDVLSGGRLDLGVGAGWQREEYLAEGLDFDRRGELLTDTIAACRALWRDTPARFDSPSLSFRDVYCEPKPLQPGGVPLWIAGTLHARNVERIVRSGDGWIPIMGESVEGVALGAAQLRDAWKAAGRDPAGLHVRAPLILARGDDGKLDLARSMESVGDLVAAGATDVQVPLQAFCRDPESAARVLRDVVAQFQRAT
ncbi:MAG: TIGR03619 family F420-dependent LLM class oxidoreductase [Actinomycetota bacterium]